MQNLTIHAGGVPTQEIVLNYKYLMHPSVPQFLDRISNHPFQCDRSQFKVLRKINLFVESIGKAMQEMKKDYEALIDVHALKDDKGVRILNDKKDQYLLPEGFQEVYESEFLSKTFQISKDIRLTDTETVHLMVTPLEFPAIFPLL